MIIYYSCNLWKINIKSFATVISWKSLIQHHIELKQQGYDLHGIYVGFVIHSIGYKCPSPSVFFYLMFELVCILSGMTNPHTSKKYFLQGTIYCDCVDFRIFPICRVFIMKCEAQTLPSIVFQDYKTKSWKDNHYTLNNYTTENYYTCKENCYALVLLFKSC